MKKNLRNDIINLGFEENKGIYAMNEILSRINEIMKLDIENNNVLDIWRYEVIDVYGFEG